MNRDNLLFAIIGILLGFIVGFLFANSISQRDAASRAASATDQPSQSLPANHPPVSADQGADPQQVFAQVQAAMKQAREEPTNFDAQITAAKLEYQVQRFNEAIEFLLKANQLRPNDSDVLFMLGVANVEAGRYDAAEKWYRAALVRKPDDVPLLSSLCDVLLTLRKAKPAEDAINKLARVAPNSADLQPFRDRLAELKK